MPTKAIDDELAECVKTVLNDDSYPSQNIRIEPDNIVTATYPHDIENGIVAELYFDNELELRVREKEYRKIPAVAYLLKQINDHISKKCLDCKPD